VLSPFSTVYTHKSQGLALAVSTGRKASVLPSPPYLLTFLTKHPLCSPGAALAVIVPHQGNNVVENKAFNFTGQLLHLIRHAVA